MFLEKVINYKRFEGMAMSRKYMQRMQAMLQAMLPENCMRKKAFRTNS